MNNILSRIIGVALIIASVVGLIFSLFGLVSLWRLKPGFKASLVENIQLANNALEATSAGLAAADTSLTTSIESISALVLTINTTSRTIESTAPMVDTFTTLMGEDFPTTITNARTSLVAAQESARIIDTVLTALTRLPFVSRDLYNPPVPLHIALENVTASMDDLPAALETAEKSLSDTGSNLEVIQADIDQMATDIDKISTSLEDAQEVVEDYQSLVSGLQRRLERMEQELPPQIDLLAWVLTIFLTWMAVVQLGLFTQGWELLTNDRRPVQ